MGRWWERILAGSAILGLHHPLLAQEPMPTEPYPVNAFPYLVPVQAERPTQLPDFNRPIELPPLLPAPNQPLEKKNDLKPPLSKREGIGRRAEYDPAYLFLPDRNPGPRLPPCPCLPLGRWWLNGSYFLGTTKSDTVPALVTGGGTGNPASPGTRVLSGDQGLTQKFRSGLRIETGLWLDRCQNWGLDAHFFVIESSRFGFEATSPGSFVLSRPFLLEGVGPQSDRLAGPGIGSGTVKVSSPLSYFSGDVNSRHNLTCEDNYRLDLLLGYRYFRLDEKLTIESSQRSNLVDISRQVRDEFRAGNIFHGGQIGLAGEIRWQRLFLDTSARIAFGQNFQELDIRGASRISNATLGTIVTQNGVLTAPSNLGRDRVGKFAVVPEANLNLGYQLSDHFRTFLGYNFVYLSSVARPGQAIDTTVSPTSLVGLPGNRPTRLDPSSDFWVQGITFGVEMRY